MIKFKGRFSGRQHIRGKPNATGLKLFCFCDLTGFCYSFWLYLGKESTYRSARTKDIVLDFSNQLPSEKQGRYCIITDSYFSTMELAEELNSKQNYIMCIRGDRIPKELWRGLIKGLCKGKSASIYNTEKNIIITAFFDRKLIGFISNYIFNITVDSKSRPLISSCYNRFMNSVDIFDQNLNQNYNHHKRKKWTQCWYYSLFKIGFTNSNIYYNKLKGKYLSSTDLLKLFLIMFIPPIEKNSNNQHYPILQKISSRCKECLFKKKKSNTKYTCSHCNIYLHPKCWMDFHQKR